MSGLLVLFMILLTSSLLLVVIPLLTIMHLRPMTGDFSTPLIPMVTGDGANSTTIMAQVSTLSIVAK